VCNGVVKNVRTGGGAITRSDFLGSGTKTGDLLLDMSEVLLNGPIIVVCGTNTIPR